MVCNKAISAIGTAALLFSLCSCGESKDKQNLKAEKRPSSQIQEMRVLAYEILQHEENRAEAQKIVDQILPMLESVTVRDFSDLKDIALLLRGMQAIPEKHEVVAATPRTKLNIAISYRMAELAEKAKDPEMWFDVSQCTSSMELAAKASKQFFILGGRVGNR